MIELFNKIKQSKYNQDITFLIETICRPGYTCLDIGANYGYTSVLLLKKVGLNGKVYSWEPNTFLFENYLTKIQTPNVTHYNKAVSNSVGTSEYYSFSREGELSSLNTLDKTIRDKVIKDKTSKNFDTHIIDIETLDNWWKQKNKPNVDLIKIDVEGYEDKVIHGSLELLKTYSPILIIECHSRLKFNKCKKILKNIYYFLDNNVSTAEQFVFKKND